MQGGVAGHCEETGFCSFPDATCGTGQNRYGEFAGDDLAGTCVVPRITPLAPSATNRMYQGTQRGLRRNGVACTARIAAGIGQTAFCFLGADDDVKCAGTIGGVSYGPSFVSIGLGAVEQIMMIFGDIGSGGMCATRTDHVVVCQGSDPNVFATSEIVPASFTPWTTLHFAHHRDRRLG